jgi:quercetin dioxygenase-like cupin family protein
MVTLSIAPLATQLQDEIEYGEKGMFRKCLVKNAKRQAMLVCLKAGIEIPEHTSSYDGFITVIEGRGVFHLSGREIMLTPGTFIELPADTRHALTVEEDLAMLKVVDAHEPPEPPTVVKKASCQSQSQEKQAKQSTCVESLAEMLKPFLQQS